MYNGFKGVRLEFLEKFKQYLVHATDQVQNLSFILKFSDCSSFGIFRVKMRIYSCLYRANKTLKLVFNLIKL